MRYLRVDPVRRGNSVLRLRITKSGKIIRKIVSFDYGRKRNLSGVNSLTYFSGKGIIFTWKP